jgi:hypothetical protein
MARAGTIEFFIYALALCDFSNCIGGSACSAGSVGFACFV